MYFSAFQVELRHERLGAEDSGGSRIQEGIDSQDLATFCCLNLNWDNGECSAYHTGEPFSLFSCTLCNINVQDTWVGLLAHSAGETPFAVSANVSRGETFKAYTFGL